MALVLGEDVLNPAAVADGSQVAKEDLLAACDIAGPRVRVLDHRVRLEVVLDVPPAVVPGAGAALCRAGVRHAVPNHPARLASACRGISPCSSP
ncbi:hypothetical protein Sros01_73770 [Streptomyces roseochromogenus]|nr:hypothetical protein Sros01_73770 [Streptomyces roseochromogenus]